MAQSLPLHIMDNIVNSASSETCREYCRNRLVCRDINTREYHFKLDGSDDPDDFFDHSVEKYTLGQLKNPESDLEIAFAKKFMTFFDKLPVDKFTDPIHESGFTGPLQVVKRPCDIAGIKRLCYQLIVWSLVRNKVRVKFGANTMGDYMRDSDSLRTIKERLVAHTSKCAQFTYKYIHGFELYIS